MTDVPLVVLDTSVTAKWYLLDEELQVEALSVHAAFDQGRISVTMPDVARYELANALSVARKRGRIGEAEAQQAIANFLSWDFTYVGTDDLILAAVDAARRFDCALSDALYLALAESIGCDLVTADRVLLAKAHPAASWVKWLGDYAAQ
jgi:predicted nucleic acid-binding protein